MRVLSVYDCCFSRVKRRLDKKKNKLRSFSSAQEQLLFVWSEFLKVVCIFMAGKGKKMPCDRISFFSFCGYVRHVLPCYTFSHPKIFLPQSQGWIPRLDLHVSFSPIIRHSEFSVHETASYTNRYLMNSVTWSSLWTFQTLSCSFALSLVSLKFMTRRGLSVFQWHTGVFVFSFLTLKNGFCPSSIHLSLLEW